MNVYRRIKNAPRCMTFSRNGGNVRRFLLRRNVKIGGFVTFVRYWAGRWNRAKEIAAAAEGRRFVARK